MTRVAINYRRSAGRAQALSEELGPRAAACEADVTDADAAAPDEVFDTIAGH
jgi:hypothetical protein